MSRIAMEIWIKINRFSLRFTFLWCSVWCWGEFYRWEKGRSSSKAWILFISLNLSSFYWIHKHVNDWLFRSPSCWSKNCRENRGQSHRQWLHENFFIAGRKGKRKKTLRHETTISSEQTKIKIRSSSSRPWSGTGQRAYDLKSPVFFIFRMIDELWFLSGKYTNH